jgi:uracil-DNA glycosylase
MVGLIVSLCHPKTPYSYFMLFGSMHPSWQQLLAQSEKLLTEIENQLSFDSETTPPKPLVMRAFQQPLDSVKVLLIGQDPYPTEGVACGLAFAVSPGSKKPQSLKNLMKELASDIPEASNHGELSSWTNQGVILLNSALTTKIGSPGAHAKIWSGFTSTVIRALDRELSGRFVCLSLGEHAKKLSKEIALGEVIQATHPSPLSASRGFFGSRIYSRVNQALGERSIAPIDWSC